MVIPKRASRKPSLRDSKHSAPGGAVPGNAGPPTPCKRSRHTRQRDHNALSSLAPVGGSSGMLQQRFVEHPTRPWGVLPRLRHSPNDTPQETGVLPPQASKPRSSRGWSQPQAAPACNQAIKCPRPGLSRATALQRPHPRLNCHQPRLSGPSSRPCSAQPLSFPHPFTHHPLRH